MGKMLRGNNKLILNMATMCDIVSERLQLEMGDPTIRVDHITTRGGGTIDFEISLAEKDTNAAD